MEKKTNKQDGQTNDGEHAMKKEDFDRKLEEALVFGRRSSIARTPPPSSGIATPSGTPHTNTQQKEGNEHDASKAYEKLRGGDDSRTDTAEGDSVWLDEEMMTSPIFKLYESQRNDSQVTANSPAKKKRKRDELPTAEGKEGECNKEMLEVQTFLAKLGNKTEQLKQLVKENTAEHTVFECDKWCEARRIACVKIGYEITPETLIPLMLESAENWKAIQEMIRSIMSKKETDERFRQNQ
ncbi:hypothetical protein MML48_1g05117 [Holotrichia oblita]|uniref:Uncharacterized protein n=1 Tax=Holotrichia oblita TaxID=644536 RepID=A0ACB9TVL4_HOLOL|nr:hypothetical protein MML48_1g05117 [Holotrichia oblita]